MGKSRKHSRRTHPFIQRAATQRSSTCSLRTRR
ncbi:MAG: hypothetical protein KGZ72_05455 [Roseovarius sp.]|nr:hypothetical protein [Roseovarius sp.]